MSWQPLQWLGWASPGWLGALGLLAVPIAIHLLSRGRQRRVAVGSVRWLGPAPTARARRVRPSRWWLLALRCLLLALVALALAAPQLKLRAGSGTGVWALVSPTVAAQRQRLEPLDPEVYAQLDSVLAAGSSLRWLAPGVAGGELDDPPPQAAADSWSLLHEASREAPPATAFEVFTLDRAEDLRGARPALEHAVTWHAVVDPGANRWIERAVPLGDGHLAVSVGTSDPAGTSFERFEIAPEDAIGSGAEPRPGISGISVESGPSGRQVALADGGTVAADDSVIVPDSSPVDVTILAAPGRIEDAGYVRAAIEAVRDSGAVALGSVRRIEVDPAGVEALAMTASSAELVFWLSPDPVPAALRESRRTGGILVSDALDRSERCDCVVRTAPGEAAVRFDRRGDADKGAGATAALWEDARHGALLEAERLGAGSWVRLRARFHPGWTDLVLSPSFAAWLLDVVREVAPAVSARVAASDRRSAPAQAAPREAGVVMQAPRYQRGQTRQGERWLWLAALGLLAYERRLAARSSP
jgi:hypothetical protein